MKMCQKTLMFKHKNAYRVKILRIFIKSWGWWSFKNSEDEDPQKILRMRILRKFKGWGSSGNSEDDDPQEIRRMTVLRKPWGSSKDSEDEDPQKILRMMIRRKFWGFYTSATKSGEDICSSKNTADIFSANCDSFLRISPVSLNIITTFWGCHRNYHQKFLRIIGPVWGYHQNGLISRFFHESA